MAGACSHARPRRVYSHSFAHPAAGTGQVQGWVVGPTLADAESELVSAREVVNAATTAEQPQTLAQMNEFETKLGRARQAVDILGVTYLQGRAGREEAERCRANVQKPSSQEVRRHTRKGARVRSQVSDPDELQLAVVQGFEGQGVSRRTGRTGEDPLHDRSEVR